MMEIRERLQNEQNTIQAQSSEIRTLKDQKEDIESRLCSAETARSRTESKLTELQTEHQESMLSLGDAYRNLEAKHIQDLEIVVIKAKEHSKELHARLELEIQNSQRLEGMYEKSCEDLESLKKSYSAFEVKIQELAALSSEQKAELKVLRTREKNLRAIMSKPLDSLAPQAAPSRQGNAAGLPRDRECRRQESRHRRFVMRNQGSPSKTKVSPNSVEDIMDASFASSDSQSSQSGSTPKRRKHWQSFNLLSLPASTTQRPLSGSKPTSTHVIPDESSALRELSPNRQLIGLAVHETCQDTKSPKPGSLRKTRGNLQYMQLSDSSMAQLQAGTPLTPGNFASGTGRMPEDDDFMMTTEL
jgi:hypothetical protein